jgi:hypothetical protein
VGWPMILSMGMWAIIARTASRTAASFWVDDDMFCCVVLFFVQICAQLNAINHC